MRDSSNRFARFLAVLLVLCLAGVAVRAQEKAPPPDPFEKTIRLDAWGLDLQEAMNQIMEQTGISVRPDSTLAQNPNMLKTIIVYLQAESITVRQALEWLCRAACCRYRISGPQSVILTCGYQQIAREKSRIMIRPVFTVIGPDGDPDQFERSLLELTKVESLLGRHIYLRIEKQSDQVKKIVSCLPETIYRNLESVLKKMEHPGRQVKPTPELPRSKDEVEIHEILDAPVMARLRNQPTRAVLRDLANQSGLRIGFDHRPFIGKELPKITIDKGTITVRQYIEALMKQLGLKGYELMLPRCVWLTEKPRAGTLAVSREFLWEQLKVESYASGRLNTALGGGEALPHYIRTTVMPDIWKDPGVGVIFHPASQNLIVVAPREVQDEVFLELGRLQRRLLKKEPAKTAPAQPIETPRLPLPGEH